jgi:DNA polymerase-3 subunit beta
MPVLANVMLASEGPGGLRVAATDLYVGVTGVVGARVKKGGSTTASARTLFDIVRNLPAGEMELRVEENQWLRVRSGRVQYRIAGIPADDFPELPSAEGIEFFSIGTEVLQRLMEGTYYAVSADEARPHLNSGLFEGEGKTLRMVATDGHRLSLAEHSVEQGKGLFGFSMLVPLKGIQEIRKLLEEGHGEVDIGVSGTNAFFRRHLPGAEEGSESEVTMSVKLVEARFPPYDKVIPQGTQRRVVVSRQGFLEALRRASLISREKMVAVRLTFGSGKLVVTSDNPDVGEAKEEMDIEDSGADTTIGFNGRYLVDVLSSLGADEVEIGIGGASDACVIKPVGSEGFLAVVMPMRL